MDLAELCNQLVKYGLVDMDEFRPAFVERLMREGGGVEVLRQQNTNLIANIQFSDKGIEGCVHHYGPEVVETYFILQELADHARRRFLEGVNEGSRGGNGERRGFTDQDRERLMERVRRLEIGFYRAGEIGEPLGLTAATVGTFLAHLDEEERRSLGIKYADKKWERY